MPRISRGARCTRDLLMMIATGLYIFQFELSWSKPFSTVRVSNVLSEMSSLGRYSLLSTNCQQSMKKLLAELTLQMPPGLKTLGETIDDAGAELFEHEDD
ncbi:hypothetical protein MTO96_031455 [Rhipicephalus appendiculatus]